MYKRYVLVDEDSIYWLFERDIKTDKVETFGPFRADNLTEEACTQACKITALIGDFGCNQAKK